MNELGMGENPFGIKMKLHLGPSDMNALAAAPPTTIVFGFKVPPDARLEFNTGSGAMRRSSRRPGEPDGRFYRHRFRGRDRRDPVPQDGPPRPGKLLAFNAKIVDLSRFAGRDVSFRLVTEGDARALAFWFNPVIYRSRREARHVILISLDTLRSDHLSCYGYGRDTSPNIDLLARDGVLFAETRAPSPWTLPSHISLMTALDTVNHGVVTTDRRLDPRTPTLAELLKAKEGSITPPSPAAASSAGSSDSTRASTAFASWAGSGTATPPRSSAERPLAGSNRTWTGTSSSFSTPIRSTIPIIRKSPGTGATSARARRRSAVLFNHLERFKPESEQMRRDIIGLYDGEIRYTDETPIRPLVAKLKALGIYDRTMIVLTSDHGEEFFEHGAWLHTHSVYDEVIRVPLIIKFFGSRNAGRTVSAPPMEST